MKRKTTLKLYVSTIALSFKISFQSSAPIMFFRLITLIIGAFVPIINITAMKNIINGLTDLNEKEIYVWFIILGVCQIATAVLNKITSYLTTIHSDRIALLISKDIINKINELDISYYDDPKLYNELINVTRDINSIPSLIWNVLYSVQIFISLISAIVILFNYIWWSPIIIIISCLPNFIIDKKYALKMYKWNRDSVNEVRKMNYSYDTLTSKYFSKDIRINNLKSYLYDKYIKQWKIWYNKKHNLLTKQFVASFISMFLPNVVTLLFAGIILNKILDAEFTVGDFSYYIGIMGQLTSATFGIISTFSQIIEQKTKIEYYNSFISWKPIISNNGTKKLNKLNSIIFQNVSFKYPNTDNFVLKNVSFEIKKGEKIGLVGRNGCGKTTIVKLLLHLYEPTEGKILINNIDLREYDVNEYYKTISTLMQDYVNFSFTLRENTKTTDLSKTDSNDNVINACKNSDAYQFISMWENTIDEYLTKSFDSSGKELSGGQWQKIALSRFFYKEAELFIMDEPSASIDIESEKKIFDSVFNLYSKNTLILISHRLSNLKDMSKIIVMDDGFIIEQGDHTDLMANKNVYFNLYNMQKEKYS